MTCKQRLNLIRSSLCYIAVALVNFPTTRRQVNDSRSIHYRQHHDGSFAEQFAAGICKTGQLRWLAIRPVAGQIMTRCSADVWPRGTKQDNLHPVTPNDQMPCHRTRLYSQCRLQADHSKIRHPSLRRSFIQFCCLLNSKNEEIASCLFFR